MSQTQAAAFALHLRVRAPQYFVDFGRGSVEAQLTGEWARPASRFYRFRVGTKTHCRSVLVKVPRRRTEVGDHSGDGGQSLDARPRLGHQTDPAIKFQLEYIALTAIHKHFDAIGDPRFGAIRILDILPGHRAIVMEEVEDPSLSQLFLKASRLRVSFSSIDLGETFRNAGAWLRAYHALPKQRHVKTRHTQRADFVELLSLFTGFLGRAVGDEMFFQDIAVTAAANALETLPESLPLGLGHGDYALRNILVGPNNQVTVLDTLAKWQTPIYEDIAHFLIGLKTNRLQVYTQGVSFSPACLTRYEQEFLGGYFGQEPIPYREIQLYEILSLLNKWSSRISQGNTESLRTGGRAIKKLQLALTDRFFRENMNRLLRGA